MARPTKLTPERRAAILHAIELGCSYEHAALAAGISIDTLAEWRKRFPPFSAALKEAEARGVLACLRRIEEAASNGTWQAAAWRLERRYPAEWGRRARMEVEQHTRVDMGQLADAQAAVRAAVQAALANAGLADDADVRVRLAAELARLAAMDEDDDAGDGNGAAGASLPFPPPARYTH